MSSVYVIPRNHVLAFVALHHVQQKRKYTNEPYTMHLQAVAELADAKCKFGYEIGLCHDLLEDTTCTTGQLLEALGRFGYSEKEAAIITHRVVELTDVFTTEAFPQLNRAKRKALESDRLHKISREAQTVKYCDLINNCESIVQHDKGFARLFLSEAKTILNGMNKGNPVMYKKVNKIVSKGIIELGLEC